MVEGRWYDKGYDRGLGLVDRLVVGMFEVLEGNGREW